MVTTIKNKIRIGCGFDVHALQAGLRLMLGGIEVPHHSGLKGHSDGDVLLHAVADALLGAVALGDIGLEFPSEDARWKDADSGMLLAKVVKKVHATGWQVGNLDTVVIAEAPRLSNYIQLMRSRLAELLLVEQAVVSVKATTTDKLGFTGRAEGIAAQATVILESHN